MIPRIAFVLSLSAKKAVEFRDNMPISVHAKGRYICLFGDYDIVIINWIINTSQRYQP